MGKMLIALVVGALIWGLIKEFTTDPLEAAQHRLDYTAALAAQEKARAKDRPQKMVASLSPEKLCFETFVRDRKRQYNNEDWDWESFNRFGAGADPMYVVNVLNKNETGRGHSRSVTCQFKTLADGTLSLERWAL